MCSISTSRQRPRERCRGFTIIELLIGLALAACLAAAVAAVWLPLQQAGQAEADRAIWYLQSRVAVARLEKDLRLSSASGCRFPAATSVLEATPTQLVFLEREGGEGAPLLVEWEIVRGSVMRRWGPCPETKPASFSHSLFRDSKTMLEAVEASSCFRYIVAGREVEGPIVGSDLGSIEAVALGLVGGPVDRHATVASAGRVAR